MYKYKKPVRTSLKGVIAYEGESLEKKVERVLNNKEPIKDGAPELFTERKDGIKAAYNIRADRWEIALDAMTAVNKSHIARRAEYAKIAKEGEEAAKIPESAKTEPVQGKS